MGTMHNKTSILTIYLMGIITCAYSQGKEYTLCTYHYFKKGGIASSECYDKDKHWGKACAYNKQHSLIYEKNLRRIAGHSSVEFEYYPSGAVKKAKWSDAPDAGIQWYRSTTEFSEDGQQTAFYEDSYDDRPSTTLLKHQEQKVETTVKPKPAECASIYSSEFWILNTTKFTVNVNAHRNNMGDTTFTLKPGENVKGGAVSQAQYFDDPAKYYQLTAKPSKTKNHQKLIILPAEKQPENTSKEVRRYYFDVRRII